MPKPRWGTWLLGALLLVSARCAGPVEQPEVGPEQLALRLFELARDEETALEEIERVVELPPGRRNRTSLLEALDRLGGLPEPRVEAVVPLPGLDRVAVDLVIEGSNGESSRCSVQLARTGDDWKILWFAAPGLSWPRYETVGNGLATRPSAGDDAVR